MSPRVSVVIPIYNRAQFIGEAVSSVLASTYEDFELLLIDDGSTDDSLDIASRVAGGDPRLRIVELPHGGVAVARNTGLREAAGELIANLDADDAMFPRRIERQITYLDRHAECVAVGSRALFVDAASRPMYVGMNFFSHADIDRAHLEGRPCAIGHPLSTFRKAAVVAAGGYASEMNASGEDYDLWLRLAEVGHLANIPEVLTRYRVHGGNMSLDPSGKDYRLAITMDSLARAFARRGMVDRTPRKIAAPPLQRGERVRDAALNRYFAGDRAGAISRAAVACLIDPASASVRHTFRTVLTPPPRWPVSNDA
jgi:glycosyltransferase involved in cell wall biosynthesis